MGWRGLLGPRDPSVAEALDLLGYVYDEIGEYGRGRDAFANALAIREAAEPGAPRTLGTRSDLGYLYLAAGDPGKAQEMFESVLATDKTRAAARQGLARALQDRGDLAKARELASALVAEHRAGPGAAPSTAEVVRLAEIDLALGRPQDARAELRGRRAAPPAASQPTATRACWKRSPTPTSPWVTSSPRIAACRRPAPPARPRWARTIPHSRARSPSRHACAWPRATTRARRSSSRAPRRSRRARTRERPATRSRSRPGSICSAAASCSPSSPTGTPRSCARRRGWWSWTPDVMPRTRSASWTSRPRPGSR